jgi:hypothetical protein
MGDVIVSSLEFLSPVKQPNPEAGNEPRPPSVRVLTVGIDGKMFRLLEPCSLFH